MAKNPYDKLMDALGGNPSGATHASGKTWKKSRPKSTKVHLAKTTAGKAKVKTAQRTPKKRKSSAGGKRRK